MSELAVATFGVTKRYRGDVLAVDRVDLRVARGEIYGFLGPNGAGKSTTIRMLLGMIAPTAGHAELFGERVRAEAPALWRRVGHLVESATAYPELTTSPSCSSSTSPRTGSIRRASSRSVSSSACSPSDAA
jgi:ABC-type multidrug transport system ATPase subunit